MSSAQCQHNLNSEGVGSDGNQEAAFCKEAASTKANQPDSAVQGGCLDHQPSSKPTTDRARRLDDRNSAQSDQNCRADARAQARQGNKVNETGSEPCIRIGVTTTPALQSHSAPLWQVVREAHQSFQPRHKQILPSASTNPSSSERGIGAVLRRNKHNSPAQTRQTWCPLSVAASQ